MIISLAHEIVHLFVGYLTGQQRILTPPELSADGFDTGPNGESGRYWESILLQGNLEMWYPRTAALKKGVPNVGIPYAIVPRNSHASPYHARLICPAYIDDFVNRRKLNNTPARPPQVLKQ